MSEFISNHHHRLEELNDFARGLLQGGEGRRLIEDHRQVIETVSPAEAMQVLDNLLAAGLPLETVKAGTGKIINAFYKSLSSRDWDKPGENHFLSFLMRENRGVEKVMADIKAVVKQLFDPGNSSAGESFDALRHLVSRLKLYDQHYIKKENILFPYIEKAFPQYRCLELMWSFHDDFRKSIKNLDSVLDSDNPDKELLTRELGKLFFVVLPIIFREEQIVFPVAIRAIPPGEWDDMIRQGSEIGWCYIDPPLTGSFSQVPAHGPDNLINLGSGVLTPEQLMLIFSNLPVDITFVDENDEVRFFSEVKDRIFPRSRAIIGRKVQNCHPPESVHIVNEIVDAFRHGRKDHADFWIQFREKFVHIRYFALRNADGEYKGTIEVTQDVTTIRNLQGDRRLLDWDRG